MNEKVKAALRHLRENWRSTLAGFLSAVIGLSAVGSTPNPWINSAVSQKILGASAIARVILGVLEKDK